MEKESKINARRFKNIPSFIFGAKAGTIFVTLPYGLHCKEVIHATTMRHAGHRYLNKKYGYRIVNDCLVKIYAYCEHSSFSTEQKTLSLAIPLLGTGTGGLDKNKVLQMIDDISSLYPNIETNVYL